MIEFNLKDFHHNKSNVKFKQLIQIRQDKQFKFKYSIINNMLFNQVNLFKGREELDNKIQHKD